MEVNFLEDSEVYTKIKVIATRYKSGEFQWYRR